MSKAPVKPKSITAPTSAPAGKHPSWVLGMLVTVIVVLLALWMIDRVFWRNHSTSSTPVADQIEPTKSDSLADQSASLASPSSPVQVVEPVPVIMHKVVQAPAAQRKVSVEFASPRPDRSPLLQVGEQLSAPIPAPRLDGSSTHDSNAAAPDDQKRAPSANSDAVVPWYDAPKYMGQPIIAEGVVVDTRNTGSVCFINFSRDRESFYVIIFKDAMSKFPQPPEQYFRNQKVRVRGVVVTHKDRPQIQVRFPDQIQRVE